MTGCVSALDILRGLVEDEDADVKPGHLGMLAGVGVPFPPQTRSNVAPTSSHLEIFGIVLMVLSKVRLQISDEVPAGPVVFSIRGIEIWLRWSRR